MLTVTDLGLSAIRNAQVGGFWINLDSFKVSAFDLSTVEIDYTQATSLQGAVLYEGRIAAIETISTSAVRLTLTIPINVPQEGTWEIREIGIYLQTGELFAYGKVEPYYTKSKEYGLKIYALVTASRLSEVLNVTVSQNNSLAAVPHVRSLVKPTHSEQNAVIVLDQQTNRFGDESTAHIAVKSGPGATHWAFLGHNRVYRGGIDQVLSPETFALSSKRGGFWLNDGEVVIVQIVSGFGDGYSRKAKYDKTAGTFTVVDKPWANISAQSVIAVWRSVLNQLPTREYRADEYLVLGIGENTWKRTLNSDENTKYAPVFISGELNASGYMPSAMFAGAETSMTFAFVEGRCVPLGTYEVSNSGISIPAAAGKHVEVYAFKATPSSVGGTLHRFEASYTVSTPQSLFHFPVVPESTAWVMVYVNDEYQSKSSYVFSPTSISFTSPVSASTVRIVLFATYEDDNAHSQINRYFFQAVEGQPATFSLDAATVDTRAVLVHATGQYFGDGDFTLGDNSITLTRTPIYVNGIAVVDVSVFSTIDAFKDGTAEGVDTGPVWVDPAGRLGPPNKLVPRVMSYMYDGDQTEFAVYAVPRKANIVMFAAGVFQDPRSYTYTGDNKSEFGTVKISGVFPEATRIDFVCFTDVKDSGTATVCEVFDFVTTSAKSYTIDPTSDPDSVMVFMEGVYQHKVGYQITSNNTLTFYEQPPSGMSVEVWYFKTTPREGWRTEMYADFNESGPINSYPMSKIVVREQNTLLFLGSVYQNKAEYKIADANSIQQVRYETPLPKNVQGLPLINVYFVSGTPLTRLMLREDAESQFMPKYGPSVDWSNLSHKLRNMLACPISKLLSLLTGEMKQDFNRGSADDQDLANKYGLAPVTENLTMQVLPTAAYASVGSGALLGVKVQFNVYKYLELYLKEKLGSNTFTIKTYEQGKKYFISDIQLGAMRYEALKREDIPMITLSTGIYIDFPNALTGVTYAGVPLLTSFFDMRYSRDNVTLPSGFTETNTKLKTKSVSVTEDDSTQSKTFTHEVINEFDGKTYTVKWKRPYRVVDQNVEYMTLVSSGGAPGYVRYFARLYAQWKYKDADIIKCMWYNKKGAPGGLGGANTSLPFDQAWNNWVTTIRERTVPYPATAGYTEGLTFGVVVDNFDESTGTCDLAIVMTSGTIGYSYFPAEMLMKKIEIPVQYTIYPAISVKPDGTVEPMLSNEDLFSSCCWTDFTPAPVLDCGTPPEPKNPTVVKMTTSNQTPIIQGTYPHEFTEDLTITIAGQTFTKESTAVATYGEVWEVDLGQTSIVLTPGYYDVAVRVVVGENTLTETTVNEIYVTQAVDTTPPMSPTVNAASYTTKTPVITGTYPANDAAGGFSVIVNNWVYAVDSVEVWGPSPDQSAEGITRTVSQAPLTVSGNNWSLDMSHDPLNELSYGTWEVVAAVKDASGNASLDKTTNEIVLIQP